MNTACPPHARAPGAPTHVTARDLGVRRGDRWVFRHLNLTVPRGSFVAVVGPSGVGKTSLLACLAGLLSPEEGAVQFLDDRGTPHPPLAYRRRTGLVFQQHLLVPNSTLLENVACGRLGRHPWWRTCCGLPRADRDAAFRLLDDLGLGAKALRWAGETSGGEQQRTAIARALLQEPDLYLADEPVANLDAYLAGRILGILRQEASVYRRTVFCVLHQADLVSRFADWVLSLDPSKEGSWHLRRVDAAPAAAAASAVAKSATAHLAR